MAGHIEHDRQAQIAQPGDLVQEPGDPGGREAGQGDGKHQAEHQHLRMVLGRPGDGQHVIQRHGDIGDEDLDQGADQGLGGSGRRQRMAFQHRLAHRLLGPSLGAQIAPHAPGHPQQEEAAGQQQAHQL